MYLLGEQDNKMCVCVCVCVLAAVASGLLSWGHFISSDITELIAQIRGGKSTKILYSSKSTITLLKFYLSTSKSTSLKIYSSKSKK